MDSRRIIIAFVIILLIICLIYLWFSEGEKESQFSGQLMPVNTQIRIRRRENINPNTGFIRIRILRRNNLQTPQKEELKRNKEKPNEYFESLQEHDNDSQNVHDSQVISSLKRKYQRLLQLNNVALDESRTHELIQAGMTHEDIKQSKIDGAIWEIRQKATSYFRENEAADVAENKLKKIDKVLKSIAKGNPITSISEDLNEDGEVIPITEDWILTLIWERIHHPANESRVAELEIALFDQLVDCIQKSNDALDLILHVIFPIQPDPDDPNSEENDGMYTVCINGRVGRIISSLSLLDTDDVLAEPEKDNAEYANLAYLKAGTILQNGLKEEKMEELYVKDREKLSSEELAKVDKFEKHIKEQIEKTLLKEYRDLIPPNKLAKIIKKAQKGV